ncbi:hypothetical protein [Flavobacterium aquiphilum]|uniref:hypothetical protein n=1 Tax=Flavobacterium aquiphilum TaxID=3003261 RepID=UPI00247FA5A2|nr:hypothetical protein [Flavobacterium aquiphilum]
MKRKLCTLTLISISFLIYSCSNDDEVVQGDKNYISKEKNELGVQSTEIKNDTLSVLNLEAVVKDGEPSNPTPK